MPHGKGSQYNYSFRWNIFQMTVTINQILRSRGAQDRVEHSVDCPFEDKADKQMEMFVFDTKTPFATFPTETFSADSIKRIHAQLMIGCIICLKSLIQLTEKR